MVSRVPWPREYYGAIEFFYWEPQWLNRHAAAIRGKGSVGEVITRIGASEVGLNHLLNIFFSIAPDGLVVRFFSRFLDGWTPEPVESFVRPNLPVYPGISVCQTDLLFEGASSLIAIEIKVDAKTSLDQIVKYALFLHHFHQPNGAARKRPFLLFLTKSAPKTWPSSLSFSTFRDALVHHEFGPTIVKFASRAGHSREQVVALATALPVFHLTYTEIRSFLADEVANLDRTDGAETLRNLVNGLVYELIKRELVAS